MLIFSLSTTLPLSENERFAAILWSLIDAATECEFGRVTEGIILPGVHGDSIVNIGGEGVAFLSPYKWSDEVAVQYPQQCDNCDQWIDAGSPCFHRALLALPLCHDVVCKACAGTPSSDTGDAFASQSLSPDDVEFERLAKQAMGMAAPYGWDGIGGGF